MLCNVDSQPRGEHLRLCFRSARLVIRVSFTELTVNFGPYGSGSTAVAQLPSPRGLLELLKATPSTLTWLSTVSALTPLCGLVES